MKPKNIFTYSIDLVLLNKCFKVLIQSLEPNIFKEKVEVLFGFFYFIEYNFNFHIKYLWFLNIVWLLVNIYSIEPSPDYK